MVVDATHSLVRGAPAAAHGGKSGPAAKTGLHAPAAAKGKAAAKATTAGAAAIAAAKRGAGMCTVLNNTDFWGDALVWGTSNTASSAAECCSQCAAYAPEEEHDMMDCNGGWVGGGRGGGRRGRG